MIIVLLMESEILKMKLMKSLNLKDKFLKLPIIQGGMGIGVSRLSSGRCSCKKRWHGGTLNRPDWL